MVRAPRGQTLLRATRLILPWAVAVILATCTAAHANIILPVSFIYQSTLLSVGGVAAVLVIEFAFLRGFVVGRTGAAILGDVAMNVASALIGLLLIPIAGLIIDQVSWKHGMGHVASNAATFLFVVAANTVIEGYALQRVLDRSVGRREYVVLFVANVCSTGVISAAMAWQARQGA